MLALCSILPRLHPPISGLGWLSSGFFSQTNPIKPKTKPILLLILKDIMGSFCKKTFFFPPPFPVSFTNALRPDCPLRQFRGRQNYSENSEGTEGTESAEETEPSRAGIPACLIECRPKGLHLPVPIEYRPPGLCSISSSLYAKGRRFRLPCLCPSRELGYQTQAGRPVSARASVSSVFACPLKGRQKCLSHLAEGPSGSRGGASVDDALQAGEQTHSPWLIS